VAAALGAPEAGGAAPLGRLAALLRGRRLLLVLDNCEHVAAAAPDVAALLGAGPGLTVLATSRSALRVAGEQAYRVPPLAVSDPQGAAPGPAVRLFVERARAVRPEFALTPANARAVAAICARLDGLPLALELAAARTDLLPPAALLDRLERDLGAMGALAEGPRDAPARQRTMRAAVAWSHNLLAPQERALFRRLAVFAGGATLDAAEAVCAAPSPPDGLPGAAPAPGAVLDLLGSLLRQSLLVREGGEGPGAAEPAEGEEAADGPRVRLLEPVRDFALEELEGAGELAALRRRHAAYYHALARRAGPHLTGPGQVAWLGRLAADRHNLRAAVRALLAAGEAEAAVDLLWAIWRYWRLSGQVGDARRWVETALAGGSGPLSVLGRGHASLYAGMVQAGADPAAAVPALEEGLRLCRDGGDPRGEALALLLLGMLAASAGDGALARGRLERSLDLFRRLDESWGVAVTLEFLGLLLLLQGDHLPAGRRFAEALAVARGAGDRVATHQALYCLGRLARAQGDEDAAAAHFAAGLRLAGELRDRANTGYFITGVAEVAAGRGRHRDAARLLGAADAILDGAGSPGYRLVLVHALEQPWHERAAATAREALGATAFEDALAEGRSLPLEQAVAAALEACAGVPPRAGRPPG